MAEISSNLGLKLPDQYDTVDVTVLSDNFRAIDDAMHMIENVGKIADNLTTEEKGFALDASQGKVLKEAIDFIESRTTALDNAKLDLINVADNLTTNNNTKVLSAAQGVVLKELVDTKANIPLKWTGTFSAGGWSGSSPYTQDISNLTGMTSAYEPDCDVNWASVSGGHAQVATQFGLITCIATGDNKVTGYCYSSKPTVDIPIRLKVVV